MHGKTIAEKILSRAAGKAVRAGEIAICTPDLAMGTDGSIPMALDYLEAIRPGAVPCAPQRLVFALDHYGPASGPKAQELQQRARIYALTHGIATIEAGAGIGHQCILESGEARPGRLLVGADSHSTSYGAANAFATGIGSSDLAGVMLCGKVWLKVPETMRVTLTGCLAPGVSGKDVALTLARLRGADGANYRAMEFQGSGVATLDMEDRIVLANMAVELGAKAGIFPYDDTTARWLAQLPGAAGADYEPVQADPDAHYTSSITLALDSVRPQAALPHRVDNVVDIDSLPPTPVDMVYLGTCTGGRLKDYREALDELQARGGVAPGVRLVVTPASESIRRAMEVNGMLAAFTALGAELQPPGCGSCCGTCGTVPADGQTVISTANRNFKGRMGNAAASIVLASPRSCGAAAASGYFGTVQQGSQA
ncbi:3-isopropylmalate dehydratase large subunit [Acidovorax sp. SRB_14]|uniref:3-isopropylmalate dehydratase large subunit n=1 Tax=Acidovorax sp. SRB_14 TaxID=1962699 RepID=UPI00156318DF|nr:aconitase/3-isopropylmalate dehydratase large subunit family protein [Acidovorax sp. SRB_14]NMM82570.1 3-isopropylmalate dehydratase large subunit [Acidovorax sp. SRB_14]